MSILPAKGDAALPPAQPALSHLLTFVMAAACGAMVANLYYSQALIGLIAPALGMNDGTAGLIVTITQAGYGIGLLLVVSLADLVENRRLVLLSLAGVIVGLVTIALATTMPMFLIGSFLAGFASVGAQILVPFAAHIAPESCAAASSATSCSGC